MMEENMRQETKMRKGQSHWPRNSVGFRMTKNFAVVPSFFNLEETRDFLSKNIKILEVVNPIYVVGEKEKLIGVFPIKDLFRHSGKTKVRRIAKKELLVTVAPESHQEEAVYLALQHHLEAIAVVDKQGRMLGVMPTDKILTLLYRELREDILRLAGIHRSHVDFDNILEMPITLAVEHRLPWLILGLLGGLVAAYIIGHFEETLEKNLILASFIPLVVYLSDAVQTQLGAFAIRDLALFRKFDFWRYFLKQFFAVSLLAFILGGVLFLITFLLYQRGDMALVLSSTVIIAVLSALLTGLLIPFILRKFKFDPANASGPIGTIVQDILSVLIYFGVASLFL